MKKGLKVMIAIVLTPVITFLLLLLLLYIPPVQNWAVKKVAAHISETTNMTVSLKHVRLSFPLDLQLDSLLLTQPNLSIKNKIDTIADMQQLIAKVQLMPLIDGKVEVDELTFKKLKANTANFIGDLRIRGDIERLHLISHNIDIKDEALKLNRADIRGGWLDIALGDTIPKDTTKKKTLWKIKIDKINIDKTRFALHLPGDSLQLKAQFDKVEALQTQLLLHDDIYKIGQFDWNGGAFSYVLPYKKAKQKGFDANHLHIKDINIGLSSFIFSKECLKFAVRAANMREGSGLTINELSGAFAYNNKAINLSDFHIKLPTSMLNGRLAMDLNAFDAINPGRLTTALEGYVTKADLKPFLYAMPRSVYKSLPAAPLKMSGTVVGNLQHISFRKLRIAMLGHFDFSGSGNIANIVGKQPFYSNFSVKGNAANLYFIRDIMPKSIAKTLLLPRNIGVNGHLTLGKNYYAGNMFLSQGGGTVKALFAYNIHANSYKANIKARHFPLHHFLPTMGLSRFSGALMAYGRGTDVMSQSSYSTVAMNIAQLRYDKYTLDGFRGKISKYGNKLFAAINSTNKMIGGRFTYKGNVSSKLIDGHIKGHLTRIDLHSLGAMKERYVLSGWTDAHVSSNMKDKHFFKGTLHTLKITDESKRGKQLLLTDNLLAMVDVAGKRMQAKLQGHIVDANLKGLNITKKAYHIGTRANILYTQSSANSHNITGKVSDFALTEHRDNTVIPLLKGSFDMSLSMKGKHIGGSLEGNLSNADLYEVGVVDKPLRASGELNISFASNGGDELKAKGLLGKVVIDEKSKQYTTDDVLIDVASKQNSFTAKVDGGDFHLYTTMDKGLLQLGKNANALSQAITKQIKDKHIDQQALLNLLPRGILQLKSGGSNLFRELLSSKGYSFAHTDVSLMSSPSRGLDGVIKIDSLVCDSMQMDKVNIELKSTDGKIGYNAWVANSSKNSYPYTAFFDGALYEGGIKTHSAILDEKGRVGIDIGLQLAMAENGLRFNIISKQAIVGYKTFNVNPLNYIYIGRDKRVSANLDFVAKDGTGLKVRTDDDDEASLQNLTLSVHKFELGYLFRLIPFMPNLSGELDGDYHIIQTPTQVSVSSDMGIKHFVYENSPIGNVGLQMVYMPKGDKSHYIDAIISKDDVEVGTLNGTYDSAGEGCLNAVLSMNKFPLSYVNGFIPEKIVGLYGEGDGSLTVQGKLSSLDITGKVYAHGAYLRSDPYGVKMRFGEKPLVIEDSKIALTDFKVYDNNNNPLTLNGTLDISNTNNMMLNVALNAQNFQLINAKENPRSEAYGKAIVDFMGSVRGEVSNLHLSGILNVLGSTDMNYIVKDQSLMSDTKLQDLVKFANFKDTTTKVIPRGDLKGFSMDLHMNIDEQARIKTILNPEHTNYIDMIGGGNLNLSYDPVNGVQLRGRYTLNSGKMKYTMDVIPLRTFYIRQGSYVNFTGDPMLPTLNIEATENVRANVSTGTGSGRLVDFLCGVKLTKQFPKPSIEFIIEAPEDQEMTNSLKTKSVEERSKLAVTMLASGLYFDGDNISNANNAMSGALASFLQTQVNSITGRALNSMGLDLSANLETAADVNGALHTDYTFKFSKRLWNNRLKIILGGRVSTGSALARENGAYFDNFSIEYRLNRNETKYLKLYYEREAYDWLEGNLSEYGIGFLWRRKISRFWDILRLRKDTGSLPKPVIADTIPDIIKYPPLKF